MRVVTLSRGGQVSIPADIRKRWPSNRAIVEELPSGAVLLQPLPADPLRAVIGSLAGPGPSVDEMLDRYRADEIAAERRKWGWLDRP